MAELVLGAVGVVPIIGIAIKSYRTLCSELKTFRNCDTDVKRLHKRLRMMGDPANKDWEDREWDGSLRDLLKSNYEVCEDLVNDIVEAVKKLESRLACFRASHLKPRQRTGEKMKDTWKRVSDGMKLCFNKSDYQSDIDELRSANAELRTLREQVTQLQNPSKILAPKRPAASQGWSDIRTAAEALYEALRGAWSCGQVSHLRHFVKLFLEAEKTDGDVRMDIAIVCYGYGRGAGNASLIQLQVRSGYVAWTQTPRLFVPSDADDSRPKKRMKSVRFSEECSRTCTVTQASYTQAQVQDVSADLRASRDFCSELMTRCGQTHAPGTRCLGHLDVSSNLRHSFYPSSPPAAAAGEGAVLPMDAFLHSTAALFSACDRLKMARALVLAVLKFYATPWLADAWTLGDFALFRQPDMGRSLRTLHLGVEFNRALRPVPMEGVLQPGFRDAEDEILFCGIENKTLHSLGVALLQIDRMEKLDIGDVVGVRKQAGMSSSFGPKYQKITQQCLRCDFGFGADLTQGTLQRAVYGELIGALEVMISSLSIEDEE